MDGWEREMDRLERTGKLANEGAPASLRPDQPTRLKSFGKIVAGAALAMLVLWVPFAADKKIEADKAEFTGKLAQVDPAALKKHLQDWTAAAEAAQTLKRRLADPDSVELALGLAQKDGSGKDRRTLLTEEFASFKPASVLGCATAAEALVAGGAVIWDWYRYSERCVKFGDETPMLEILAKPAAHSNMTIENLSTNPSGTGQGASLARKLASAQAEGEKILKENPKAAAEAAGALAEHFDDSGSHPWLMAAGILVAMKMADSILSGPEGRRELASKALAASGPNGKMKLKPEFAAFEKAKAPSASSSGSSRSSRSGFGFKKRWRR